jgi:hypothetical protein
VEIWGNDDLLPLLPVLALVIAAAAYIVRRWIWPFALGVVSLPAGAVLGMNAYRWFGQDRFGGSFRDLEWAVTWACFGSLAGAILGLGVSWWRERRRSGAGHGARSPVGPQG